MGDQTRGRVAAIVLVCAFSAIGCNVPRLAEAAEPCVGTECLRPVADCAYDSADCNPAVDDLVNQVRNLRDHGQRLGFHLGAMPAPSRSNHWQSIQRMAGAASNIFLATRSTKQPADTDLAVIELGSRGTDGGVLGPDAGGEPPASDRVIAEMASATDYTHAGGTQLLGKVLAVPLERNVRGSRVELIDLKKPAQPVTIGSIAHAVTGGTSSEAGTASLARLDDGHVLLVIGRRDAATLDFYRSTTSTIDTTKWELWDTWDVSEIATALEDDDEFGDYQNLNLIAGNDGKLYLLGLHEDGLVLRSQWIDLFELGGGRDVTLTKVAKRRLRCEGDCNLDAGGGSYIDAHGKLIVYGIEYANDGPGASVKVVEFSSPE
jgi:hypothetical protein